MRMFLAALSMVLPICLALVAAPASAIYAARGPDPGGVYLLVSQDTAAAEAVAIALGARPIGPVNAPLSVLIAADEATRSALKARGYLVLAGSNLAEICGFNPWDNT